MDVKEYFKRGKAVKWWNPIEDHKQKDIIKLVDPKRKTILDAGVGKGRFVIDFLNYGSSFILALDISKDMLRITREYVRKFGLGTRVSIVVGDIEHLPLRDGCFDVALCVDTLVHLANPQAGLRELKWVIKDSGMVIVDETPANPIRQLFENEGLKEKISRFLYHCVNVGIRIIFGERVFWRFYEIFLSPFAVPWTSYTKKEFLSFIKNSGLKVQLIKEYGKLYAPSVYLALCVKMS